MWVPDTLRGGEKGEQAETDRPRPQTTAETFQGQITTKVDYTALPSRRMKYTFASPHLSSSCVTGE